ncbi:MAG: YbaN family protein [Bacteroidetes bacterium]|nr:YbaN family protein [Bacteroidota bacterium]MBL6943439.1 YbaN family protein [Bacteroidales bacterium]
MKSDNKNSSLSYISKPVWNILGRIFAGIGITGIFIPLLPTTPFLLLAAYCFNRGSESMPDWFVKNKLIGQYLNNYREKKGISLRSKMNSIFLLWFAVGASIYLSNNLYIRIILVIVIVGVTTHILLMPTLKK